MILRKTLIFLSIAPFLPAVYADIPTSLIYFCPQPSSFIKGNSWAPCPGGWQCSFPKPPSSNFQFMGANLGGDMFAGAYCGYSDHTEVWRKFSFDPQPVNKNNWNSHVGQWISKDHMTIEELGWYEVKK